MENTIFVTQVINSIAENLTYLVLLAIVFMGKELFNYWLTYTSRYRYTNLDEATRFILYETCGGMGLSLLAAIIPLFSNKKLNLDCIYFMETLPYSGVFFAIYLLSVLIWISKRKPKKGIYRKNIIYAVTFYGLGVGICFGTLLEILSVTSQLMLGIVSIGLMYKQYFFILEKEEVREIKYVLTLDGKMYETKEKPRKIFDQIIMNLYEGKERTGILQFPKSRNWEILTVITQRSEE